MESPDCPVCYLTDNVKFLNCSHYLCVPCYKKMNVKECPLCRVPINQSIFKYKPPTHTPTLKCYRLKEKLELFFRRRNFLEGGGFSKKYRRFLFCMLHYGGLYYYKGVYYPVYPSFGYIQHHDIYSMLSRLLDFYKYLLTCERYLLPDVIRKQLITNVEDTFRYYD